MSDKARGFLPDCLGIDSANHCGIRLRGYTEEQVIAAISAALRTAPDGYKLMPVEHTHAIYSAWCDAPHHEDDDTCFSRAYSAMLAAAQEGAGQ